MSKAPLSAALVLLIVTLSTGCWGRRERLPFALPENPVVRLDTADPGMVLHDGILYSYSTSGCEPGGSLHIRRTADGVHWEHLGFILRDGAKPGWIGACDFWAPEVHRIDGRFVAYYAARGHDRRFRIGAAVADQPAGPFEPWPLPVAEDERVSLIDASFFRDPATGRGHLLWKEDGNDLRPRQPTPIMMAPLSGDGLSLVGPAVELIRNDAPWEGDLVEAPYLIHRKPYYYLFFSGNAFFDDRYGIGVARSRSLEGPYEKFAGNPILRSDERFSGPGHCFLLQDGNDWRMFHHARVKAGGRNHRLLMSDMIEWTDDGWCRIAKDRDKPQ